MTRVQHQPSPSRSSDNINDDMAGSPHDHWHRSPLCGRRHVLQNSRHRPCTLIVCWVPRMCQVRHQRSSMTSGLDLGHLCRLLTYHPRPDVTHSMGTSSAWDVRLSRRMMRVRVVALAPRTGRGVGWAGRGPARTGAAPRTALGCPPGARTPLPGRRCRAAGSAHHLWAGLGLLTCYNGCGSRRPSRLRTGLYIHYNFLLS
mmetsp:Transcript_29777/g.80049  ORF Transcript_29777/g.80049 Transcript_29777/m.80049 type:complete len:201 (-) Transcript_29777:4-606(-)